jgi:hypothetical protein
MCKHPVIKHKGLLGALSFILILWLSLPGCADDGSRGIDSPPKQNDTFDLDPILFRLALSQHHKTNLYPLFTIANNSFSPDQKKPSQQMGDNNLRPIPIGKQKKSDPWGNSLFTASLFTLTALNIADYVSTVKALRLPGLEEANPLMRPFSKNILLLSTVKLGISALDLYLLKNVYKKNKTLGWILSIAGNLALSYIVSQNFRKIRAVSGK